MTASHVMIEDRVRRIEDRLEIEQLPIRYAIAVDERDIDAWAQLFVPDVQIGRELWGREALRNEIVPLLRQFYRSIHQIVGHRIELVDDERAVGNVYCRAEHEVGERWIVMAIRYDDEYRRVDGQWLFVRRKERHWYAADLVERPQAADFEGWQPTAGKPNLPGSASWSEFWASVDTTAVTAHPIPNGSGGV